MKRRSFSILLFSFIVFGFTACDMFRSNDDLNRQFIQEKQFFEKKVQQYKEIELKKLELQTKKELALIESKKELAKIEKEKELTKIKLNAQYEKERLELEQKKQKLKFEQKIREKQQAYDMEIKRYIIIGSIIIFLFIGFFVYFYYKRKRDDKLQAYKDNLEKYFRQKENETRVEIATKMLDVIKDGALDKDQQTQLIGAFSGAYTNENIQDQKQKLLKNSDNLEDIQDIEIVEK